MIPDSEKAVLDEFKKKNPELKLQKKKKWEIREWVNLSTQPRYLVKNGHITKLRITGWNNLISFDQSINTLLGGLPDETISSRMGKLIEQDRCPFCYFICTHLLHRIDPNHCQKSIERDEN